MKDFFVALQPKILCGQCGNSIRLHDRFCATCGTEVDWTESETAGQSQNDLTPAQSGKGTVICPSCGVPNRASNEKCVACGSLLFKQQTKTSVTPQHSKQKSDDKKRKSSPLKLEPWHWLAIAASGLIIIVIVIGELRNTPKEISAGSSAASNVSVSPTMLADIDAMQKTVDANPNDTQAMLHLANMLHDAHFYPRAIEMYKKYLAKKPADPNARVDMGICYLETGDAPTAAKEMETALKYDPKHQMAMFNLGIVNLNMGNVQQSNEWLRKAIKVDSTTTVAQRAKDILSEHSQLQ